jgi:hypothetical protein
MKLFLLTGFGLMVAMSVAAPPLPITGLEKQLEKLQQLADERAKLFNELLDLGGEAAGEASEAPAPAAAPAGRLRMSGLVTGKLQPSSGLQSGARGLTPEEEWRRMFPHKPGYSR